VYVAKCSDELWVGVKCQTNQEIAGSPRNAFRCSLGTYPLGGRALNGLGGASLPNPIKLRIPRSDCPGVRRRVLRFVVERETAQIAG
jgi:hypothetical protein